MTPESALAIVLRAALANANGHERSAEILEAIKTVEIMFALAMLTRKRVAEQGEVELLPPSEK